MAATGRHVDADITARFREAGFVRLAPAATGDGVAAAGVLARTLERVDVPYQVTVVTGDDATRRTEADLVVGLDCSLADADLTLGGDRPASANAFDVARSLTDESIAPTLAAAGVLASGDEPAGHLAEALADAGIKRRPGVAVPTEDLVDGLAHTTLVHAPFSGDRDTARATLEAVTTDPDEVDDRRRVASLVALETTDAAEATARAAKSVESVLRPYVGGPFETLEGYADVLSATVQDAPGTAIGLALGQDAHDDALDSWRRHARTAHDVVREGQVKRHAGCVIGDVEDGPIETVARLLRDFRSPEPIVVVLGDARVALAATEEPDAEGILGSAMAALDNSADIRGDSDLATLQYVGDHDVLVDAIREVIRDA